MTVSVAGSSRLHGQLALVTGGGTGLGRQFALALARAGARVVVCGRRVEPLERVVAQVVEEGGEAHAVPLDLADTSRLEQRVEDVIESVGLPTILVNNAGLPDARRAHRMSIELVDAVVAVNLKAPWILSTALAGRWIEAKQPGRIVNISSMSAFHYAGEGAALYSTTKAAVNRMTESLAVEWARHGINVNAIAPGAFASEMMDGMLERLGDFTADLPRGRLGQPAQLESALLFLVDPFSDAVTGTVVKVDDGQTHR